MCFLLECVLSPECALLPECALFSLTFQNFSQPISYFPGLHRPAGSLRELGMWVGGWVGGLVDVCVFVCVCIYISIYVYLSLSLPLSHTLGFLHLLSFTAAPSAQVPRAAP